MGAISLNLSQLDPSQDPALLALIAQQQAAAAAAGVASDPDATDGSPAAVQGMSGALRADPQAAGLLEDAATAGTDTQVDLQGLSLIDQIKLVFGGVNQGAESTLRDQLTELDRRTQLAGTLGSFKSQLEAMQTVDHADVDMPASVLDALQDDGVDVASLGLPAPGADGNVVLTDGQMDTLVNNVQSAITANDDTQQTLYQQVGISRDTVTEDFQLMSSSQSDVHESLMEIAKDS